MQLIILLLLGFIFPGGIARNSDLTIFDVTAPVNELLTGKNSESSRNIIEQALRVSKTLFYNATVLGQKDLSVFSRIVNLLPRLPVGQTTVIVSVLHKRTSTANLKILSDLVNYKPSGFTTLQFTPSIAYDFDDTLTKSCFVAIDDLDREFVVSYVEDIDDENRSRVRNQTSRADFDGMLSAWGTTFKIANPDCQSVLNSMRSLHHLHPKASVTILARGLDGIFTSYTSFKYMQTWLVNLTNIITRKTMMTKISYYMASSPTTPSEYREAYSKFSLTWALEQNQSVILAPYNQALLQAQSHDLVEDGRIKSVEAVRRLVIPEFRVDSEEKTGNNGSTCMYPKWSAKFRVIASQFDNVFLPIDDVPDLDQVFKCQPENTSLNFIVSMAWPQVRWFQKPNVTTILHGIRKYLNDPKMPIKAIVLLSGYYTRMTVVDRKEMKKFVSEIGSKAKVACLIDWGSLENSDYLGFGPARVSDVILNNKCEVATYQEISLFILQFKLEFDRAEHTTFSHTYFATSIQNKLDQIEKVRQFLLRSRPGSEVVLRLVGEMPASIIKRRSTNLYCDPSVQKINRYYEDTIGWAEMYNFSIVMKNAFDTDPRMPVWWDEVQLAQGTVETEKTFFGAMRNYPPGMTYLKDRSPCIEWSKSVPPDGIQFGRNSSGASLKTKVPSKGVVNTTEMRTMLVFTTHKFHAVEIVIYESSNNRAIIRDVLRSLTNNTRKYKVYVQYTDLKSTDGPFRLLDTTRFRSLHDELGEVDVNKVLRGLHVSNWDSNHKTASSRQEFEQQFLRGPNVIPIGLVIDNCGNEVNNLLTESNLTIPTSVSYIVCNEQGQHASNEDRMQMAKYLEGHWTTKMLFAKYLPRVNVLFRVNPSSRDSESGAAEKLLRFTNDIAQFGRAYGIQYFFNAFDDSACNTNGWWRVNNYYDLIDPENYVERESEFLERKTWRPPLNQSNVPPLLLNPVSNPQQISPWVVVGLATSLLTITALAFFLAMKVRQKNKYLTSKEVQEFLNGRLNAKSGENGEQEYISMKFNPDFMLDKSDIRFETENVLGMGNFGVVYRAIVCGQEAAVKIPKSTCSKESFCGMLGEVKIMSHIGNHEYVLTFIGAYVREIEKGVIYIATEICSNGNLQSYLRQKKSANEYCEDKLHFKQARVTEMVKFCYEIAVGMEYISSKKIIHGDLSTRNVLLDEYVVCKIGDFGLSRKLYEYNKYIRTQQEPLPWRWMAHESLKFMEFSTQSDVWSFGVTLWEIFTLGEVPYGGLAWNLDFADDLGNGLRLKRPDLATTEIYYKMLSCWNIDPKLRCNFQQLGAFFKEIRDVEYESIYLKCTDSDQHSDDSL